MIRKFEADNSYVVECDVCGGMMDEEGYTYGDAYVFPDKGNAGVFILDYGWDRIGNYVACPCCIEKINRGEVSLRFIKH